MQVIKNEKTGKYDVRYRYKDFTGKTKQSTKRGFKSENQAKQWYKSFIAGKTHNIDMLFKDYIALYLKYKKGTLRPTTYENRVYVINKWILPFFGERRLCDIDTADVLEWHNALLIQKKSNGEHYEISYLKTIHVQLAAMFNYAIKVFDLPSNPASKAGNLKDNEIREVVFWTLDEYQKFIIEVANKEEAFMGFEILYWCGLRIGELLALTKKDINFETNEIDINKTYNRIHGEDKFGPPKTPQSYRKVLMPKAVAEELKHYMGRLYNLKNNQRLFERSKKFYGHELNRGAKAAQIKEATVHSLRHSHVSLLCNLGYQAVEIGKRIGHSSERVTFMYAHMFPTKQQQMVDTLDIERSRIDNVR